MPLNYSKWDALELSDDSDIEGHPNVDKRSLINLKRRTIHEQREARKQRIAQYKADIACNEVLEPRLQQIAKDVEENGFSHFQELVEQFKTNPSPEKPATDAPEQKTYDEMLLSLMLQVWEDAKKDDADESKVGEKVKEGLKGHVKRLREHQAQLRSVLAKEEAEQKKKITSDDLREGWDSHYVPPKPEPAPIKHTLTAEETKKQQTTTKTKTEIEVINPKGVASAEANFASTSQATIEATAAELAEEEELPELTPTLEAFSKLPLKAYEQSWDFIKQHRDTIVPGASDALLVAAFRAQSEGKADYAKRCVHQSLLLQYCDKLGKDGVSLFFRKMVNRDPRATAIFEKDVIDTYAHLVERVRLSKVQESQPVEQIQLVPENPETQITFTVPDGPPPEHLELEGPGFENVTVEEVRKVLQVRWDVFQSFRPELQEALKGQDLNEVNKVLGSMRVEDAEEVVKLLDMAGILNMSGGIRDETGQANAAESDEEEEEEEEAKKD